MNEGLIPSRYAKALHLYAHFLQPVGYVRRGLVFVEG